MYRIKILPLIFVLICAALWLFAPFVAVNIITLKNQPTALQFITDDITYIGNIHDNASYLAAWSTLVAIGLCLIFILLNKPLGARIVAIIAEIPLILTLIESLNLADGEMEDLFKITGFGFWGILITFLVIIITSGKGKTANG